MSIFPVSPTHESLSQVREWALHLQSGLKETQSKDVMPEGKEAPPPWHQAPCLTWWGDDPLPLVTGAGIERRFCPGFILIPGLGSGLGKLGLVEQILHLTVQGHHLGFDVFGEQHWLLCGGQLGLLSQRGVLPGLWARPAQLRANNGDSRQLCPR